MTQLKFMPTHPVIYFFSVAVILVAGYFSLNHSGQDKGEVKRKVIILPKKLAKIGSKNAKNALK